MPEIIARECFPLGLSEARFKRVNLFKLHNHNCAIITYGLSISVESCILSVWKTTLTLRIPIRCRNHAFKAFIYIRFLITELINNLTVRWVLQDTGDHEAL
ncbi:hypothetical protein A3195_16865 [Candidatus Thiodiazotropha endoloripes]|uniref:Uncharacterized protein n=1 Tax=Candidatus Thiodiazotropha endoloripes TaxID=1818881 RepID=A0A1E2UUW7_9GAMM|nr:hypothetical protein A3195_16865 [Candidatus Thiodiazotropha endoloripes]ODB98355.1 hypothetical protein A3196_17340 [Candidatus Thiodiazotropha endoloripes]